MINPFLLPIVLLVVAGYWLFKRLGGSWPLALARSALVIKQCVVNKHGPVYVHIVGRKAGLLSWLFSIFGVDPTTTLDITENRIEMADGSLSGRVVHMIPMSAICNLGAGYSKPVFLLVLAVAALLLAVCYPEPIVTTSSTVCAVAVMRVILLLVAILLGVSYYLKRTFALFFVPSSAVSAGIGFKRSVIEGVGIDETTAFSIIDIVSGLIEKRSLHGCQSAGTAKTAVQKCPNCGEELEVPDGVQAGQNVRCPYCNTKFSI